MEIIDRGKAQLVDGQVIVNSTKANLINHFFFNHIIKKGTLGSLSVGEMKQDTSFVILSTNKLDNSLINWFITN